MKLLFSIITILILAATISQLYKLEIKKIALEADFNKTHSQAQALISENAKLEEEIKYLKDPENLAREAKAQLNYAKPGEKLIIVVPKKNN